MGLKEFYKLRNDFILIGLTGRMGGGTHDVGDILCSKQYSNYFDENDNKNLILKDEIDQIKKNNINEGLKYEILHSFIKGEDNFTSFQRLKYKSVILFQFLFDCKKDNKEEFRDNIIKIILDIGQYKKFVNERFGSDSDSTDFINKELKDFLEENLTGNIVDFFKIEGENLHEFFENSIDNIQCQRIGNFFFSAEFTDFAEKFFDTLDLYSHSIRIRFVHILAYMYRICGKINLESSLKIDDGEEKGTLESKNIYFNAKTIKYLVKVYKRTFGTCNIVIDSLKNSFEVNYFRERFSGFYLVAVNRDEDSRVIKLENKINNISPKIGAKDDILKTVKFDETEYKTDNFKDGNFAAVDVENCIQKSDYHIYIDKEIKTENVYADEESEVELKYADRFRLTKPQVLNLVNSQIDNYDFQKKIDDKNTFSYKSCDLQILKLICLIKQPGIITPSALERCMQIAFNAKYNSGCISRQVGAVVTDKSYSIKGVGWNEVPEGQTPCSLRSIYEFKDGFSNPSVFTDFEKNGRYEDDNKSFKDKIVESLNSVPVEFKDELNGRNCPYCFKEFHNSFEGQKNQVHTRSLHAEENAMLQITKYGGQPLKGGHLFTTASPCELCSKKAFQLGIQNIFYIDPYPGISRKQILKGGNNEISNPNLYMYQGVVGRGFNKLYEPFMSIKDETKLRTKIKPVENDKVKIKTIKNILEKEMKNDTAMKDKLDEIFKDDRNVIKKLTDLLKKGLENSSE